MSSGLVKSWVYCPDAWEGKMVMMLPLLQEKQSLELVTTAPSRGAVEGLFAVRMRQDLYSSEAGGYVQRLWLRPWKGDPPASPWAAPPLSG